METYEEKYKKALEKAKSMMTLPTDKAMIEEIFPELKESEGERIRKELIEFVKSRGGFKQEYIAWLEKQGEQKLVPDWMPKFLDELRLKKNYFDWDEHKEIEGEILAIIKWMNPNYFNGKDGEQKVEPKFKVGDVIRLKGSATEYTIKKVTDTTYYTNGWSCGIERCEEDYELVEQKPWSEEDEKFFKTALWHISYSISNGKSTDIHCDTTDWLKSLKDRVQPQPRQEWSEEDEKMLQYAIEHFERQKRNSIENGGRRKVMQEFIDWLKSFRPQSTWKPSDEQMTQLFLVANQNIGNILGNKLMSLYNDLTKLTK